MPERISQECVLWTQIGSLFFVPLRPIFAESLKEWPNTRVDAMCTASVLSYGIPLHLGLLLNVRMSVNKLF